jgi:hypothetical protein
MIKVLKTFSGVLKLGTSSYIENRQAAVREVPALQSAQQSTFFPKKSIDDRFSEIVI